MQCSRDVRLLTPTLRHVSEGHIPRSVPVCVGRMCWGVGHEPPLVCLVFNLVYIRQASARVFVPLTIGGGIKGFKDVYVCVCVCVQASARVFVPLTVGGGIKGFKDATGKEYSALEVAAAYFR